MKKILISLILLAIAFQAEPAFSRKYPVLDGRVVAVYDGDTLKMQTDDKKQYIIRLSQIDAPELKQPYGQQSKIALSKMCFNRFAKANIETYDQYKRAVAVLRCGEREVNLELLKQGLAWVFDHHASINSYFYAQSTAKKAKINIWSQRNPKPPWEFRRNRIK